MTKLLGWLEKEIPADLTLKAIGLFLLLHLCYVIHVVALYQVCHIELAPQSTSGPSIHLLQVRTIVSLWWCVIVEECLFRLPLVVCRLRWLPRVSFLVVSVISSFIFGWVHGGWSHLPLQGVTGLLSCGFFLKMGGMHGSVVRALAATAATHFLYNGLLLTVLVLKGCEYFS